MPFAVSNF